MTGSQVLRINQIKGLSYGLDSAVAKHLFRSVIPITNMPLLIGNKNCIGGVFNQFLELSIYSIFSN